MNESKFWLIFWAITSTTVLATFALIPYSGYLDDKRDLEYASKGLQPYSVSTCREYYFTTEWHEPGWQRTTQP